MMKAVDKTPAQGLPHIPPPLLLETFLKESYFEQLAIAIYL